MLKFDVALCSIGDNVAHKMLLNVADPNGIGFHRAGKLPSNVADKLRTLQRGNAMFMPDKAHVVGTEFHLRRISAFLHPASCGVSSRLFMRMTKEAEESILTGTRGVDGGRKQKKVS